MRADRQPNPPCPQCGEPEGARMVASEWQHDYPCCSDKCGLAFRDSAERWRREHRKALDELRSAKAAATYAQEQFAAAVRRSGR